MGPPRLLRGLIPQLLSVDAWLPCSSRLQLLLSHFHCRLRWPSCADAFKLLLALLLVSAALAEVRYIASSSMAPTLRPADRAVAERNYGVNKDVVFIKRILATPGDFIEVRQGQLIINGVARKEHYTASHASYTMEAMVCAQLIYASIVSLNNIEELLLPGPEIQQWQENLHLLARR